MPTSPKVPNVSLPMDRWTNDSASISQSQLTNWFRKPSVNDEGLVAKVWNWSRPAMQVGEIRQLGPRPHETAIGRQGCAGPTAPEPMVAIALPLVERLRMTRWAEARFEARGPGRDVRRGLGGVEGQQVEVGGQVGRISAERDVTRVQGRLIDERLQPVRPEREVGEVHLRVASDDDDGADVSVIRRRLAIDESTSRTVFVAGAAVTAPGKSTISNVARDARAAIRRMVTPSSESPRSSGRRRSNALDGASTLAGRCHGPVVPPAATVHRRGTRARGSGPRRPATAARPRR